MKNRSQIENGKNRKISKIIPFWTPLDPHKQRFRIYETLVYVFGAFLEKLTPGAPKIRKMEPKWSPNGDKINIKSARKN